MPIIGTSVRPTLGLRKPPSITQNKEVLRPKPFVKTTVKDKGTENVDNFSQKDRVPDNKVITGAHHA